MNRFALPEMTTVTIEHVNMRSELHGDDAVPAIDLKLSKEMSNTVLDLFKPGLRKWIYFRSALPREAPQGALELEEPNDLPDLRFPELDVIKWLADQEGCTLTFEYGIAGKSNIRLTDCKANSFRLECKEGGTVKVTWRMQRSQPDERAVGKLSSLLKHEVQATMTGSPESLALLEGAAPGSDEAWPFRESVGAVDGEPSATDTFIEQHAG